MYDFLTGPAAKVAFGIFFIGLIVRVILYIRGLHWQMDRVTYTVNVSYGIKGAIRSVIAWIFPFGSVGWRSKPGIALLFFIFHFGLLFTPLFLQAHNFLLKERWGFSLWTISDPTADLLTIITLIAAAFLVLRRLALAEVRILTTAYDYILLAVTVAPFLTGWLAFHQIWNYHFWLMAHIISAEILLICIPFTKLSHVVLFFCSRVQLGMDFGIKRGGMKGKGFAW